MRKTGIGYLYFTVFSSGMTTLAIEFSASRLLGSVFGSSNLVWASIVGLILVYLTIGYFLGGKLADHKPSYTLFYWIIAWGAFTAGIVPFIARPVLLNAANAFDQLQLGVLFGSFLSVLILFFIPVTLLGVVSPFAIRLALDNPENAGKISGQIYSISTLGSFVGTFLPVLGLIPAIGTRNTFVLFSVYLIFIAWIGQVMNAKWQQSLWFLIMIGVLMGLAFLWGKSPIKKSEGQIYETESAYNYIQVIEKNGFRYLRLNDGQGVHSEYHPKVLAYHGPWMQVLSAPFFNPYPYSINNVKRIAIVGLAAGTVARQATFVFGEIPIDGYEIDPKIIDVGKMFFGMELPNLNPIAVDGRWGLEKSQQKYSLICVDAYRPPYIPWQLTTKEYFQIVRNHMRNDGVMAINVGRADSDRRLINGLVGTVSTVFPSVFVMDIPDTFNSMIFATVQEATSVDLFNNYVAIRENQEVHPLLIESLERTIVNLQETPDSQIVFTDDKAPIEWITNSMVLSFVFSGKVEELK